MSLKSHLLYTIYERELKFSVNRENTLGDTYENVNTPVNDIIQAHSQILGKFDLSLEEEMKNLPACTGARNYTKIQSEKDI